MRRFRLPTLRPREQLLASLSAVALLIVVLDRLVLNPWLHHGQVVRQEIVRKTQALRAYQALLSRKDIVFSRLKPYEDYLRRPLAEDLQMAALLKEVEELARRSGVSVTEVKPLAVDRDEFTSRYPLEVRFAATLEQWVDLVIGIETSPSLFVVDQAALVMREEAADRLEGTLRIVSESLRPPESGAPQARLGGPGTSDARLQ